MLSAILHGFLENNPNHCDIVLTVLSSPSMFSQEVVLDYITVVSDACGHVSGHFVHDCVCIQIHTHQLTLRTFKAGLTLEPSAARFPSGSQFTVGAAE